LIVAIFRLKRLGPPKKYLLSFLGCALNASGQLSRISRLSSLQFAKWQMEHRQVVDIRPQAGALHVDSH